MPDNLPSGYFPNWMNLQLESCRLATTLNLEANLVPDSEEPEGNGLGTMLVNNSTLEALVIDGVTPSVCDRVLVASQTNKAENGVYIVKEVGDNSTAWSLVRDPYFCDIYSIYSGNYAIIKEGLSKAGKIYVLTSPPPTNINLDDINFVQV